MQLRIRTDPDYWRGVIPSGQVAGGDERIIRARFPVSEYFDWFPYCNPSLNQNGDSCVGWGWSHWLTAMIKRFGEADVFGDGHQINGHSIWVRGREMFWDGRMDGGLYLPQGFQAMRDLGLIPKETTLLRVASDWDSVGMALLDTPIVQGHAIHKGWFTANHENGCLDHEPTASGSNGYHCTLRVARLIQENTRFYALQNSWGEEWALGGYGIMTLDEDKEGLMESGLYTAVMPVDWPAWDGWKQYLIKP